MPIVTVQAKCIDANRRSSIVPQPGGAVDKINVQENVSFQIIADTATPIQGQINLTITTAENVGKFTPGQSYPITIG